ncbi:hypothetical protein FQZ97_235060 [compost metagenome]
MVGNDGVEVAVLHDVEDRREGLFEHRASLLRHFDEGRLGIVAVIIAEFDAFAAGDGAAMGLGFADCLLHAVESSLVDERADEGGRFQRVADRDRAIGLLQTRNELVIDALVHEETTHGGATLAGGAHGAEGDGA